MNQLQAEQEEQVRNTTRSKFNILKIWNRKTENLLLLFSSA